MTSDLFYSICAVAAVAVAISVLMVPSKKNDRNNYCLMPLMALTNSEVLTFKCIIFVLLAVAVMVFWHYIMHGDSYKGMMDDILNDIDNQNDTEL